MPAPASLAGFPKQIYKHIQSLQVQSMQCCIWCCGCGYYAVHGVAGAVVAPIFCVVGAVVAAAVGIMLWLCLLRGHSGCCRTVLCHGCGCCVVVVGVVAPCCVVVVMGVTPCGVAVVVVVLHGGVVVVVVALRMVSLHCMVPHSWSPSLWLVVGLW